MKIKDRVNVIDVENDSMGATLDELAREMSRYQKTIVDDYIMAVLARMGGDEKQMRENLEKAVLHQEQSHPLSTRITWYLTFDKPQSCGDWIAVDARKPKLNEDVLITNGHYVIVARIVENPDYTEFGRPIKQWWRTEATEIFDSEYGYLYWLVENGETTHWMPLPEPPKDHSSQD